MIRVPKTWLRETVVILGGGPSLTPQHVETVRGRARVIAINDAYRLAPWADVLYAADKKWIDWHDGVPGFTGPKYSITSQDPTTREDWQVLENTGPLGLELLPTGLRAGLNSGYQAVNLAYHYGATTLLLLGFDLGWRLGKSHWFGDHPDRQPSPYAAMIDAFGTIAGPLRDEGVDVINCTAGSALTCFPMGTLAAALQVVA